MYPWLSNWVIIVMQICKYYYHIIIIMIILLLFIYIIIPNYSAVDTKFFCCIPGGVHNVFWHGAANVMWLIYNFDCGNKSWIEVDLDIFWYPWTQHVHLGGWSYFGCISTKRKPFDTHSKVSVLNYLPSGTSFVAAGNVAVTRWAILAVIGMVLGADYAAAWMHHGVILVTHQNWTRSVHWLNLRWNSLRAQNWSTGHMCNGCWIFSCRTFDAWILNELAVLPLQRDHEIKHSQSYVYLLLI